MGGSQSSPEAMEAAKAVVSGAIAANPVVIFSKTYCPYCDQAKALFARQPLAADPSVIELDNRKDGSDIQAYLKKLTGASSVPRVFVGGKSVGGCDDTVAAQRSGQLTEMLQSASALK